jgi:hypothetical protein
MSVQVSTLIGHFGFIDKSVGIHSSRTMMLTELRLLLATCDTSAVLEDYRSAVITENVLLKNTMVTRKSTFHWLRSLYALDKQVLLFRALRDLWDADVQAQPLLALLCANARDPILKGTAETILAIPGGETVTREMMMEAVNTTFPKRYSPKTLSSTGRNVISSWQQAGLLNGKLHKIRAQTYNTPISVSYALFLGYLSGARGEALFHTLWCRLLDTPAHILHTQAFTASQLGWIEYRHTGNITDVGFRHLLRK